MAMILNRRTRNSILFIGALLTFSQGVFSQEETDSIDSEPQEATNSIDSEAVEGEASLSANAEEPQVAPNLDLSEVAPLPEPIVDETADQDDSVTDVTEPNAPTLPLENEEEAVSISETTENSDVVLLDEAEEQFVILGAEVQPATATRLAWTPGASIAGLASPTPVLVINGAEPGPTLCLSSAVHGDELNGIEIVRRVMYDIDPTRLNGKVIGVPIVNMQGFERGSRYLPDRRDLNRYFPGDAVGSLASRIADSFFREVIAHCDLLVDLHTGSLGRTNLPQIRADMNSSTIADFTEGFDKMVVVHSPGTPGMLRTAATELGIVAVTMEVGESLRVQENDIRMGVNSIYSLMEKQEMFSRRFVWGRPAPVYYASFWLRVQSGGLLFSAAELGDTVYEGQVLGTVTDPITNDTSDIIAPVRGRIIGMAVDQFVLPGFAAYHIGQLATEETIVDPNMPLDQIISGEVSVDTDIDPE